MDALAAPSANAHLCEMAGWLHELAERGGLQLPTRAVLVSRAGRTAFYAAFLGAAGTAGATRDDLVAAFLRDRDPAVSAVLGTDKRRLKYVGNVGFAERIFDILMLLVCADQHLGDGREAHAWGIITRAARMRGGIETMLNVARAANAGKTPGHGQRKGAETLNEKMKQGDKAVARAGAIEWMRDEWRRVVMEADESSQPRPTKSKFADDLLEVDPESGLSPLQVEHGIGFGKKYITDTVLKGL